MKITNNCKACGIVADLRLGHCWDCATAESIIADGTDMFEKGPEGEDSIAKTPMEKLLFIIQKGLYRKN